MVRCVVRRYRPAEVTDPRRTLVIGRCTTCCDEQVAIDSRHARRPEEGRSATMLTTHYWTVVLDDE